MSGIVTKMTLRYEERDQFVTAAGQSITAAGAGIRVVVMITGSPFLALVLYGNNWTDVPFLKLVIVVYGNKAEG